MVRARLQPLVLKPGGQSRCAKFGGVTTAQDPQLPRDEGGGGGGVLPLEGADQSACGSRLASGEETKAGSCSGPIWGPLWGRHGVDRVFV